jgi:hypothetical protein
MFAATIIEIIFAPQVAEQATSGIAAGVPWRGCFGRSLRE